MIKSAYTTVDYISSLEPVDIPSDDDDEEALYARARRRYARGGNTKAIEHDTPDDDAALGRAQSPTMDD